MPISSRRCRWVGLKVPSAIHPDRRCRGQPARRRLELVHGAARQRSQRCVETDQSLSVERSRSCACRAGHGDCREGHKAIRQAAGAVLVDVQLFIAPGRPEQRQLAYRLRLQSAAHTHRRRRPPCAPVEAATSSARPCVPESTTAKSDFRGMIGSCRTTLRTANSRPGRIRCRPFGRGRPDAELPTYPAATDQIHRRHRRSSTIVGHRRARSRCHPCRRVDHLVGRSACRRIWLQ